MNPTWHIVHYINQDQLRTLEQVFAKGSVVNDKIVWTIPDWLVILKNTKTGGSK